jgi:GxxExxY protein
MKESDPLSEQVIGACIEVHRHLGPGLLESIYEECLCHELTLRGIAYARQVEVPLHYKGVLLDSSFRLDLVVERRLALELKSVDLLLPVHSAQLLTYLRLTAMPVGLLVNFNVALLTKGLRRLSLPKSL